MHGAFPAAMRPPWNNAAAHIGPVEHDGHGFVGSDINLLFRQTRIYLPGVPP